MDRVQKLQLWLLMHPVRAGVALNLNLVCLNTSVVGDELSLHWTFPKCSLLVWSNKLIMFGLKACR